MTKRIASTSAKDFTKNIIKGIITSILGIITVLVTLFLIFTGSMDFIWSGIAGISLGIILILAPDTIVKKLGDIIKIVGFNKSASATNDADVIENKEGTSKKD